MRKKGFTLIELIVTVMIVSIISIITLWFLIGKTICTGNFYFSEAKVRKSISLQLNKDCGDIINIERKAWALSEVTCRDTSGTEKVYFIDTNIFQNIKVYDEKLK